MLNVVPYTRDLLLVGGGHAHALVLRTWGMDPLPGARLTVINPGPTAPYTGMLPGHVAGHYGRDDLEIDLVKLCRHAGARLLLDKAVGIDRARREVLLQRRGPVAYDVAYIDVGITAEMDLPGFAEHGIGAKPLDVYAARWRAYLERAACGEVTPDVAVIGGGVAGCELAMAMAFALREAGVQPRVTVIEARPQISGMGAKVRRRMLAAIDTNAGGQLLKAGQPTDETLALNLVGKPMVIKCMTWSMPDRERPGEVIEGNWIAAVGPASKPQHIAEAKPRAAPSAPAGGSYGGGVGKIDDEIPF